MNLTLTFSFCRFSSDCTFCTVVYNKHNTCNFVVYYFKWEYFFVVSFLNPEEDSSEDDVDHGVIFLKNEEEVGERSLFYIVHTNYNQCIAILQ
jgi:hypothetical protein